MLSQWCSQVQIGDNFSSPHLEPRICTRFWIKLVISSSSHKGVMGIRNYPPTWNNNSQDTQNNNFQDLMNSRWWKQMRCILCIAQSRHTWFYCALFCCTSPILHCSLFVLLFTDYRFLANHCWTSLWAPSFQQHLLTSCLWVTLW